MLYGYWRFIFHVKTEDIYRDIADVESRLGTSNYEVDKPLPMGKYKKTVGLMKDRMSGWSWVDYTWKHIAI